MITPKFHKATMIFLIALLFSFLTNNLFAEERTTISQEGFLIYNYYSYLNFVPVKKMNRQDPLKSFFNKNFMTGIKFHSFQYEIEYDRALRYIRKNVIEGFDSSMFVTKVIPVRIEYEIYYTRKEKEFEKPYKDIHLLLVNNHKRRIVFFIDYKYIIDIKAIDYL